MRTSFAFAAIACAMAALSCGKPRSEGSRTLCLVVGDLDSMEARREFGAFIDLLSKEAGIAIELRAVPRRTAIVDALKAGKLDLVLTSPADYVVLRRLTRARPVIGFSRPDYYTVIAVATDGGIDSVEQLKGRKVAFGSFGSTSRHLAPAQVLKENGLDILKDLAHSERLHTSVERGWEMLKRGDVAAWAVTRDGFNKMLGLDRTPEEGESREISEGGRKIGIKLLKRGPPLPPDILLAGPHVDDAALGRIRSVFETRSNELIEAILAGAGNRKYTGMKFLPAIQDSDYDDIRKMYVTIGYPEYSKSVAVSGNAPE